MSNILEKELRTIPKFNFQSFTRKNNFNDSADKLLASNKGNKKGKYGFYSGSSSYEKNPNKIKLYLNKGIEIYSDVSIVKADAVAQDFYINSAIENAKYILDLETGWDGESADKISPAIFNSAMNFIKLYFNELFTLNLIVKTPIISPVNDGSVDILWQNASAKLLINISDESIGYYYGISFNKTREPNDFNGKISILYVEPFFTDWLKKFSLEEEKNS